ncbi:hypothetical protein PJL18_03889 [Paenarthrobacter nicotinovorans]|nr:hypothetical protein [Paenarthrobacter nicotinovorans]
MAPSPRTASEISRGCASPSASWGAPPGTMQVGWNWKNSRSASAAPARHASARPSAVATEGLVVWANSCPAPPVARRTASPRRLCPRPSWRKLTPATWPAWWTRSVTWACPITWILPCAWKSRTVLISAEATPAPVASPPAWRIRGAECAASSPSAGSPSSSRSNRTPNRPSPTMSRRASVQSTRTASSLQ